MRFSSSAKWLHALLAQDEDNETDAIIPLEQVITPRLGEITTLAQLA